ncbi:MAG TPA: methanogenesis marker protein Mmp4/MtxX [Methanocorpusculum sp.]|nr:methanogenesis marker protein Mmp4/MtxX [Methanocorpusculum sp.]
MIIGLGCAKDFAKVLESAKKTASPEVTIRIYCAERVAEGNLPPHIETVTAIEPHKALVNDLKEGKIAGAVRGTLPANDTLKYLKTAFGVDHLERIALLESAHGEKFFFAPVGVDEGWTVAEKTTLARDAQRFAKMYGLSEKTVILSGGRLGDIGRHPNVDKSIEDAVAAAEACDGVHGEILIEDAVHDAGVIIAPDGISGNLIFRTLTFLGTGTGHGAPVANIPAIFVDSSRASAGYVEVLSFTIQLCRNKSL